MNYPDTIYRRSLHLPEQAAQEAPDFIDFLLPRYGTEPGRKPDAAARRDASVPCSHRRHVGT